VPSVRVYASFLLYLIDHASVRCGARLCYSPMHSRPDFIQLQFAHNLLRVAAPGNVSEEAIYRPANRIVIAGRFPLFAIAHANGAKPAAPTKRRRDFLNSLKSRAFPTLKCPCVAFFFFFPPRDLSLSSLTNNTLHTPFVSKFIHSRFHLFSAALRIIFFFPSQLPARFTQCGCGVCSVPEANSKGHCVLPRVRTRIRATPISSPISGTHNTSFIAYRYGAGSLARDEKIAISRR